MKTEAGLHVHSSARHAHQLISSYTRPLVAMPTALGRPPFYLSCSRAGGLGGLPRVETPASVGSSSHVASV